MVWIVDLDGVVWLAGNPIDGSPAGIERLRRNGHRVVFVTNNAGPTRRTLVERLAAAGVRADEDDLVTSAQAAAQLVEPGERVAMVGDVGLREALLARDVTLVPVSSKPEAVVVGRTVELSYDELTAAASAIRDGARFLATNTDATFPTPHGLEPGAGAIVAFLATASGTEPIVAGKPHQSAANVVRARYGPVAWMVGDRSDTDGLFAKRLASRFALVLSGVTRREDLPVQPEPDLVGENLEDVVRKLLD